MQFLQQCKAVKEQDRDKVMRTLLGVLKRSGAHYHTRCFPLSAFSWVRRTVECVWQRISSPRGVAPAASANHDISLISTTVPRLLLRTMASQCVFGFEWGFLLIVSRVVFNKVHRLLIFIFSHFIISRTRPFHMKIFMITVVNKCSEFLLI